MSIGKKATGYATPEKINALWNSDSGVEGHVSSNDRFIQFAKPLLKSSGITIVNGSVIPASKVGDVTFKLGSKKVDLKDLQIVLSVSRNLLSVNKLCKDNNFGMFFESSSVYVIDMHTEDVIAQGKVDRHGLYELDLENSAQPEVNTVGKVSVDLWHARLGHLSPKLTLEIVKQYDLLKLNKNQISARHLCISGKHHRLPHPSRQENSAKQLLDLNLH